MQERRYKPVCNCRVASDICIWIGGDLDRGRQRTACNYNYLQVTLAIRIANQEGRRAICNNPLREPPDIRFRTQGQSQFADCEANLEFERAFLRSRPLMAECGHFNSFSDKSDEAVRFVIFSQPG